MKEEIEKGNCESEIEVHCNEDDITENDNDSTFRQKIRLPSVISWTFVKNSALDNQKKHKTKKVCYHNGSKTTKDLDNGDIPIAVIIMLRGERKMLSNCFS